MKCEALVKGKKRGGGFGRNEYKKECTCRGPMFKIRTLQNFVKFVHL